MFLFSGLDEALPRLISLHAIAGRHTIENVWTLIIIAPTPTGVFSIVLSISEGYFGTTFGNVVHMYGLADLALVR